MVVNLDVGYGVSYAGSVPDGEELRFESDGRVTLSGASVARDSYAFRGGVFANLAASHPNDFKLAPAPEQEATFAVTEPVPDAFEPTGVFPHAEGLLEGSSMSLGESRWAFFVRAAHYGGDGETAAEQLTAPVFDAAVFDESVFTPGVEPSGAVGFDWQEREPFAATLWIPQRFAALDADGEPPVAGARPDLRRAVPRRRRPHLCEVRRRPLEHRVGPASRPRIHRTTGHGRRRHPRGATRHGRADDLTTTQRSYAWHSPNRH